MQDETEETITPQFTIEQDSRSEVYEWSAPNGDGGFIIFPAGVEEWAAENEVSLVRVSNRTGAVEYLKEVGTKWVDVTRSVKSSLRSVGEATTDS